MLKTISPSCVKVPYEDIKDFISFMKNEDLSKFLMIPDDWRLLSIINQNRVQLTPGQKDMFMDFIQIELPDSEQPQDEAQSQE